MVVLNQIKLSTAFGYWDYLNVEKLIGRSFLLPISPLKNISVFFKGSIAFFLFCFSFYTCYLSISITHISDFESFFIKIFQINFTNKFYKVRFSINSQ